MNTNKKDIKFWEGTIENLKNNNSPYALELIGEIEKTIERLANN